MAGPARRTQSNTLASRDAAGYIPPARYAMNIVILDGKLLNPGDVDWGPLEALGNLKVYDDSTVEQVPQRAAQHGINQVCGLIRRVCRRDHQPFLQFGA